MCTSLTLRTKEGHHLLGRTMDFTIDFNQFVIVTPRNYSWQNDSANQCTTNYATVGMGIKQQDHILLADGVNEQGLMCATLYLPGYASYNKEELADKINLPPQDFVFWCLTHYATVDEVREAMHVYNFLDSPLAILGITPPLHWIVSDKSGACLVIESTAHGLQLYDNLIGVLTNSPELSWHLQNLRQYIGLRSNPYNPTQWGDLELTAFSQGSGSFGLPGDFTPASRFVRAAFLKQTHNEAGNELEGITEIFHILANCALPKGPVKNSEGIMDYTLYTAAMCAESASYYYFSYDSQQISAIHLANEDLNAQTVKIFPYSRQQTVCHLN
ncbi:MAG: choloylglycine hydrolase family protein [Sporolactobacillus sp.]